MGCWVGRVVAVSMEGARSAALVELWHLARLDVAHGLTADAGREWGLYLSTAITDAEPAVFSEPGMVVLDEGGPRTRCIRLAERRTREAAELRLVGWVPANSSARTGVLVA